MRYQWHIAKGQNFSQQSSIFRCVKAIIYIVVHLRVVSCKELLQATHSLHVAIETEDVEDFVCVHLDGLQAVDHDDRRVGVGTILPGRGWRGAVAGGEAPPTTAPHRGTHASALIGRGAVAVVVAAVVTTSWRGG